MSAKTRLPVGSRVFYKIKTSLKGRVSLACKASVYTQRSLGTVLSPAKINSSISTGNVQMIFIATASFHFCLI